MVETVQQRRASRVPVEHRWLGLDRRTLPFAIVVIAVFLLWVVVVPRIDDAVPWRDTTGPGEVFQVTDTVTLTPAVGWGVQEGLRTTDRTASGDTSDNLVLVGDGVALQTTSGPWSGTPQELLTSGFLLDDALGGGDFRPTSSVDTIRTDDGEVGVLESFATPTVEGFIAAFVIDGTGLQVQVAGTPEQLARQADDIHRMLAGISTEGARS